VSLFGGRWAELPGHARELPAGGLPAGFRAAGVAAGLKRGGKPDLALLVSDSERTASAARFTRNGVAAGPVLASRERCDLSRLRGVVANSGNANASVGVRGYDDACAMQARAAAATGVPVSAMAVASTGVIGVPLPIEEIERGVDAAAAALAPDGDAALSEAIRTTDAFDKRAALQVRLSAGSVRLCGQAKGAGMIQPAFATMFSFVETDAALAPETADLLLGATVRRSFDRISVDGQLSTNDTALLFASGSSGVRVEPESADELAIGEALDALQRALALAIVRDGEGSRRIGRVIARGGSEHAVEEVARAIANSPLVKTALHGGDPNWGRIAQALGAALPDTAPLPFDLDIEGAAVVRAGSPVDFDLAELERRVAGPAVEYAVGLPGDGAECEVFFSDLGHEYVSVNADYTS